MNSATLYLEYNQYNVCYKKAMKLPFKSLNEYFDKISDPNAGLTHYKGVKTLDNFPDQQFYEYDYAIKNLPPPGNGTMKHYFDTESG